MSVSVGAPRGDADGLSLLEPLWRELHAHHRAVSDYSAGLVDDENASWDRRLALYRRLLDEGAAYMIASREGRAVGYAMLTTQVGPDDTFAVRGGVAEVVTLAVTSSERGSGVGAALLAAAEAIARAGGIDTVKIAVMSGNDRAERFYTAHGYEVAERVLYRRLPD